MVSIFHHRKNRFTEEELAEACLALIDYELSLLPPPEECIYTYSDSFTAYMDDLLVKTKNNMIEPAKVRMGWQYYMRKGVAAALIAALLAGIAMPEKVMAGYKWLVEVVEEFLEDRTRYRYTSNIGDDVEFVPMKFGYMPEGMVEVYRKEGIDEVRLLFVSVENSACFIDIMQKTLKEYKERTFGSNIELYYTEIIMINDSAVKIIESEMEIGFSYLCGQYHLKGHTTVSKQELIQVLENIEVN